MTDDQINQAEIRTRLLFKLGSQNLLSIVVYPLLWTLLLLPADLTRLAPHFFWPNLALLLLSTSFRFYVHQQMRACRAHEVPHLERVLVVAVLMNAAHWSAMTVWALRDPVLEPISVAMLLVGTGMIGSGTFAVAFNTILRIWLPVIVAAPAGLTLILYGGSNERMWGFLCLAFLGYILMAAYRRQQDYIAAVQTTILLEQRTKELEHISFTDAVTGLHNRNYFDAHMELEWKRAQRQQYPVSLLMIDLDHFKSINDRYGHPAGDRCLAAVGSCLGRIRRRAGDILARIGGDEFAILLINADGAAAEKVAATLADEVRAMELREGGETVSVTLSIGIASAIPASPEPAEAKTFIVSADRALYAAKEGGRNNWQRAA